MRKLFLLIVILSYLSCTNRIPNKSINFNVWKNDTCGFLHKRESISDSIIKYKRFFISMDTIELYSYLGKPNYQYRGTYTYYITPGPSCIGGDSSGVAMLVEINKWGKVKQLRKILYD